MEQSIDSRARTATWTRRAGRAWHVWLPTLVLIAFCLPRLTLLLPAAADHADEIYQPMQTLKFFAARGQAFDKYGPTLNFILAPAYGATLLCDKLAGTYGRPSGDYPYGFADPLRQIGTLVFESRVISLLLMATMVGAVAQTFYRATRDRAAALLVTLAIVVGNYGVTWNAPFPRPDSAMIAFLGLALSIVVRIATDGPTLGRSLWLALFSAASVGAKENAGPVLATTILAAFAYAWWRATDDAARRAAIRQLLITTVAGAAFYGATNVAYAPTIWWERVVYWLRGDGLNGDVWGRSSGWGDHLRRVGFALWNNLGPAGVIVTPVALIAGAVRRPALSLLLWVPVLACFAVVLLIPYTPDRFVLPAAIALAFPAAVGVAALARGRWRGPTLAGFAVAAAVNLWWTTVTFHLADTAEQAVLERAVAADPRGEVKAYALMFGSMPATRRLSYLGETIDDRPMQAWVDPTRPPPTIVYANAGRIRMIEEAAQMPGRAASYKSAAGFDLARWPGMAALGYAPPEPFRVPVPAYLKPFSFMPLFEEIRYREVLVYRLKNPPMRPATLP